MSRGVWRILVLDRGPDDPKWIIATVGLESDVRPALGTFSPTRRLSSDRKCPAVSEDVAAWVRHQAAVPGARLVPFPASAWAIEEGGTS